MSELKLPLVLVTGASGFIGSHLPKRLIKDDINRIAVNCDAVIHLAGLSMDLDPFEYSPANDNSNWKKNCPF